MRRNRLRGVPGAGQEKRGGGAEEKGVVSDREERGWLGGGGGAGLAAGWQEGGIRGGAESRGNLTVTGAKVRGNTTFPKRGKFSSRVIRGCPSR